MLPEGTENVVENTTPEPEGTEEPITSEVEATGETPALDEPPEIPDDYSERVKKRIRKEVDKTKAERELRIRAQTEAAYLRGKAEGAVKPEPEKPAPIPETRPRPKEDDFEDYSEFVEAVADWSGEQREAKWKAEQEQRDVQRTREVSQEGYLEKMQRGREKYEDFDEIVFAQTNPINAVMRDIIEAADMPGEIAYYLGTHIHEATTIARMKPMQAAMALGKLEDKLIAAETANPTQPKPKTTPPPEPITPVGGGGAEIVSKDPNKMSYEEFVKWRREM